MNTQQFKHMADGKVPDIEADGKDHQSEQIARARDLEEVLGIKELNPFKTSDTEKFEGDLKSMSLTDLRELAVKSGVFPSGSKASLKNKLRKEFTVRAQGGHNMGGYSGEQFYSQELNEKVKNLSSKDKL